MSVTQVKQSVGSWSVRLRGNVPKSVASQLAYFGHIVIVPGRVNPTEYGDALLAAARYVGVYRAKSTNDDGEITMSGGGLEMWLGDEDGIGDVFETAVVLTGATFADSVRAVLPPGGSITEGTLNSIAGTYSGTHQYVTPRKALDYITELFNAEWRVNSTGTLDAGTPSQLFVTTPKAILVRKEDEDDLRYVALPGTASMDKDVKDFTTRVVLLGEGEGDAIAVGTADNPYNPYIDIHGNPVVVKRVVSESSTTGVNVNDRAAILLGQYDGERPNISLSTRAYDLRGSVAPGDYIYVYDPLAGFEDVANEVNWRGETVNPVALRVIEVTWPIRRGWTVAFRTPAGIWLDLSNWAFYESGDTSITVGDLPRSLVSGVTEPLTGRQNPADTTIPAAPVFGTFAVGVYQSPNGGFTRATIQATWATPLNTDTSTIVDGDHYEIRYRVSSVPGYAVKWGQLTPYKWGGLQKWGAPITQPIASDREWVTAFVPWYTNTFTILELTPGVTYEMQIRAVDAQVPPHQGPYSASSFVTTGGDIFAPSTPAAPTVAGSRLAIQITHTLGKSTGGTFNLEQDLDHFEVHVGGSDSFYPDASTLRTKVIANAGMINGRIPVVATVPIEQIGGVFVRVIAVDYSGNKSGPSSSATVTALLIDDQHISDLTVSKVTAGTIFADWLLAASIKTAPVGARAELSNAGLSLYNFYNEETVRLDSSTANMRVLEGRLEIVNRNGEVVVEIGKTTDGRYGLRVNNNVGSPQIRAGELASGGYGLEAIDPGGMLSALSTVIFGPQVDSQDTSTDWGQVTAYTAPGDITWPTTGAAGPAVTVTVGTSGRMLVILTALASTGGNFPNPAGGAALQCNDVAALTYQIVGPSPSGTVRWAGGGTGVPITTSLVGLALQKSPQDPQTGNSLSVTSTLICSFLEQGLAPGTYTITAKYMTNTTAFHGPVGFRNRNLIVLPY
jgi:hypothetical protein